jgi:cell division FtsZ-interacting protein ZapD
VIGLDQALVEAGITPDISGNRVAVRVRFQQWPPGEAARDVTNTIDYAMMLVPFA